MFKKFILDFQNNKKNSTIERNKQLKNLTSFKIDCKAKVYVCIKSLIDLMLLFELARRYNLKTFCLGGGSKVLFCKKNINTIVYSLSGEFEKIEKKKDCLLVGGGVKMSKLCGYCNRHNLSCVEWGLGIPCSMGGGVYMNAGCFGKCFGDIVKKVIYTDGKQIYERSNSDCEFAYRKSYFYNKGYTILYVVLNAKKSQENIAEITLHNFKKKTAVQPYEFPSVGSIFKKTTLPAPLFIERYGLKGLKIGGAEVSKKHCGFVINKKNASANNVLKIIYKIKKTVWKKGGIILNNEVILLGAKNKWHF